MSMTESIHRFCSQELGPWIRHPMVTLVTGVGLFSSGMVELIEQIVPDFEHFLGVHHGVILLGIVGILRGFSELVEGGKLLSNDEGEGRG